MTTRHWILWSSLKTYLTFNSYFRNDENEVGSVATPTLPYSLDLSTLVVTHARYSQGMMKYIYIFFLTRKKRKLVNEKTVTGTNGIISYGRMHLNCFTLKLAGQDFIYIHKNISLFRLHNALTCWKWIFRFWYGLIFSCLPCTNISNIPYNIKIIDM